MFPFSFFFTSFAGYTDLHLRRLLLGLLSFLFRVHIFHAVFIDYEGPLLLWVSAAVHEAGDSGSFFGFPEEYAVVYGMV